MLFDSCHPLKHKLGVIRTLEYRADTVCSTKCRVQSEKTHIKNALKKCGYPMWAFGRAKVREQHKDKVTTNQGGNRNTIITIPYAPELSEKLKKFFKAFGVQVCFKPCCTIRQKLVHPKDKSDEQKRCELIYGIKCSECPAARVGETKQALISCIKQHLRPSTISVSQGISLMTKRW